MIFLVSFAAWRYGNQVWQGHPGDIYQRWLGSRELLLNGRNPYGEEVTEEIQIGLSGHKYDPRRDAFEQHFYYPVYVVFLMAPTVRLPFPLVKKLFAILLLVLTAVSVPLWLDFLQWRITPMQQLLAVGLTLASMPALQGIYLQNLGLLVSALIAGGMFCGASRMADPGGNSAGVFHHQTAPGLAAGWLSFHLEHRSVE